MAALLMVGATLVLAAPAEAFIFVVPGVSFPASATVGQAFAGSVGVGNFSTPPETISNPVMTVSNIDLVPACTTSGPDCPGGVEVGVFQVAGTGTGSGPATCIGTWTIVETTPGTFRLTPPGGNGTLMLATGEQCDVVFSVVALRVPTVDVSPPAPVDTNQVVAADRYSPVLPPQRNSSVDRTTVVPASVIPPADFDGDGATDLSVFRPSNSVWYSGVSSIVWGTGGDVPVPGDYDFDGTTDRAVYRPSSGVWYVQRSGGGATSVAWGAVGDIPVPADYDADGKTDQAVFRPSSGVWYVQRSAGGATSTAWGASGDIPVPGDYDGDGKADQAVFRPSSGTWYVQRTSGGATSVGWGVAGDIPVPGDYDADGKTDQAVFRPSAGAWYVQRSSGGGTFSLWGTSGDIPVPGDYDADGQTDLAVFRPSTATWYVQRSSGGATATTWGVNGDIPLPLPAAIGRSFFIPPFS